MDLAFLSPLVGGLSGSAGGLRATKKGGRLVLVRRFNFRKRRMT